jgi:hypothetical protein
MALKEIDFLFLFLADSNFAPNLEGNNKYCQV